jgi:hypothetical protein
LGYRNAIADVADCLRAVLGGASARLTKLRERQLCPAALQEMVPKVADETDVEEVGSIVEMGTYPAYDIGHVRWCRNRNSLVLPIRSAMRNLCAWW